VKEVIKVQLDLKHLRTTNGFFRLMDLENWKKDAQLLIQKTFRRKAEETIPMTKQLFTNNIYSLHYFSYIILNYSLKQYKNIDWASRPSKKLRRPVKAKGLITQSDKNVFYKNKS
jgi:hypothetical protein